MRVRLFKPQFAPLVLNGTKRQTIRPTPKRLPQTGDLESWRQWMGLPYRSKQRELVQVKIKFVIPVEISTRGILRTDNGTHLKPSLVAKADGFANWHELKTWFCKQHSLPFTGILIFAEDL